MPVLGLGSKKKTNKKSTKNNDDPKNSNADEARELLKQMEAKKDEDGCPFC